VLERGDERAAVCSDCHGAHGIRSRSDPNALTSDENLPGMCGRCHSDAELMAQYGLPSDTVSIFLSSVHGRTLTEGETRGSPTCTDCHGKHGAAAPRFGSVVRVCSHCHANTGQDYEQSAHHHSEEMRCDACHEEEGQEFRRYACTACHGVHGIQTPGEELYLGEGPGSCRHCHREAGDATALIEEITGGRQRLLDVMRETRDAVENAKLRGLFLDHEGIYLRESYRALIELGPLSHSLHKDRIVEHFEQGVRRQDRTREKILKQRVVLRDRKLVLFVASFLFLLLAALLLIKLKALRRLS
jgi:predicted CXXCH cytochrome family protein